MKKKILLFILFIFSITNSYADFSVEFKTNYWENPDTSSHIFWENWNWWADWWTKIIYFYQKLESNSTKTPLVTKFWKTSSDRNNVASTDTAFVFKSSPLDWIYAYTENKKRIWIDTNNTSIINKIRKIGNNINIYNLNTTTKANLYSIIYTPTTDKYRQIKINKTEYWAVFEDNKYLYVIFNKYICTTQTSNLLVGTKNYNMNCLLFTQWWQTPDKYTNIEVYTDTTKNKTIVAIGLHTSNWYQTSYVDIEQQKSLYDDWSINKFKYNFFGRYTNIDNAGLHYLRNVRYIQNNIWCTKSNITTTAITLSCKDKEQYRYNLTYNANRTLPANIQSISITIQDNILPQTASTTNPGTMNVKVIGTVPAPPAPPAPTPVDSHFGEIADSIEKNIPSLYAQILGKTVYLYSNGTGSITDICTNALQNCQNSTIQTIALQNCIQNLNQKTPITCNTYNALYPACGLPTCQTIWADVYNSQNHTIIGTQYSWLIINNPQTQPVCSIWKIWTGAVCTMPAPPAGITDMLSYLPDVMGYTFCQVWKTVDNTLNVGQDVLRIMGAILVYQPWGTQQLQEAGINIQITPTKYGFAMEYWTGSNTETNKIWEKTMEIKNWILAWLDAILAVILVMFTISYLYTKKEDN